MRVGNPELIKSGELICLDSWKERELAELSEGVGRWAVERIEVK